MYATCKMGCIGLFGVSGGGSGGTVQLVQLVQLAILCVGHACACCLLGSWQATHTMLQVKWCGEGCLLFPFGVLQDGGLAAA